MIVLAVGAGMGLLTQQGPRYWTWFFAALCLYCAATLLFNVEARFGYGLVPLMLTPEACVVFLNMAKQPYCVIP